MNRTDLVDKAYLRDDLPEFRPGDTVKVHVRVVEAGRERIQVFQGVVIRRQGGGLRETFTVRKISFGVGVERTFPVHSPSIAKLEVVTKGRVRRAKLYYLRERRGKRARIRERREEGVAAEVAEVAEVVVAQETEAEEVPAEETEEPVDLSAGETEGTGSEAVSEDEPEAVPAEGQG